MMLNDLRYAVRGLLRAPGFALAAIVTLAIGIGANTAIVGVIDAAMFAPLPFRDADRLVALRGSFRSRPPAGSVTPADLVDYRARTESLESIGAALAATARVNLTGNGEPEQIRAHLVTGNYFETLGVRPLIGRGLVASDDQVLQPLVVVLAHGFWQRRFGGDAGIVGQPITLDGASHLVVGVMPPGIEFPPVEVWGPLPFLDRGFMSRTAHNLRPVGRLKPGVTLTGAQGELDVISSTLARDYPATNQDWRIVATPLREALVGPARAPLRLLGLVVAFVLILACANVAGLFLIRNRQRSQEIAVRLSLGASREAIARLVILEGLLVAACGAALAMATVLATDRLVAGAIPGIPPSLVPDRNRLLVTAFIVSLAVSLAVSLVPALQASRNTSLSLKSKSRQSSAASRRAHTVLAVSQLALALVLLSSTALFVYSLQRLLAVPAGFDRENVTTVRISLPRAKYLTREQVRMFFGGLLERIEAAPGVRSASLIDTLPLGGLGNDNPFTIRERPEANPGGKVTADYREIDARYFDAMRIPVLRGRSFTRDEARSRAPVAVISESFAQRFIPGDPLGMHVVTGETQYEIVGVAADVRHRGLRNNTYQTLYVPAHDVTETTLIVRSEGDQDRVASIIRESVRGLDRDVPVPAVQSMDAVVDASVRRQRVTTVALTIVASIALLIAAIGIYGVIALSVAERTREIGIRTALGATATDVRRLVLGQGFRLTLAAVAIGTPLALAAAYMSASLLFEVEPYNPTILSGMIATLATVSLAASYIPARRATRIDPARLLRTE
jgi:putative ABC transport system permease protein